ncbi:hypothetical protein JKF63_02730 [Porcisia hertigi]|uniref:Uncharacterized protein n=1 Tax=Porcisia hertigi TaxID=2761500 RepID=A0A836IA13_9TRYP|nr:hypothetical protein JKF63_02730 [Porcisia hertigi]
MPTYRRDQARIRRLFSAPDTTSELIATCDKAYVPSLSYRASTNSVIVVPEDDTAAPRVRLPFPAIDLAWCPFKQGMENAAYATACHSQPIQIWDLEDGEVRGSYSSTNDSDYHAHAHALCWFKAPTHQHWIAGGYGGFEDASQVRVFDIVSEGSQPIYTYSGNRCKGVVSAMHDCEWQGTTSLLAVGFYNAPSVHLIDCRKRCVAAKLHGLKRSVQVIRSGSEDTDPYCVYAGGAHGDSRIACWDVRKPCAPLFTLSRPADTNQVFQFSVLPTSPTAAPDDAASGYSRRLVSTCSTGGVVLYTWRPGEVPSDGTEVYIGASVGPTSGLAVVGPNTVVVSTGGRSYTFRHEASQKGAVTFAQQSARCHRYSTREDEAAHFPVLRRRQRSPMRSDSDEEMCLEVGELLPSTEATNIAVISLA